MHWKPNPPETPERSVERPLPATETIEIESQISKEELKLEKVLDVLLSIRCSMPSTMMTVILLLCVMAGMVPSALLAAWGGAQAVCQTIRYLFIRWAQRKRSLVWSARGLLIITLIDANLWGGAVLAFRPTQLSHQIALYLLINIICSARIPIFAPLPLMQTIQIVIPTGMILAGLCTSWSPLSPLLIVCELAWLVNLVRLSWRIGNRVEGSLLLRLENARLVVALQEALNQVRQLAIRDALTGIYNRYHLIDVLQREIDNHHRHLTPVSIVLLDVDHFKKINDTHGHPAGDRVLQDVVALVKTQIRSIDTLARYGGEEFVCILPNTAEEAALSVAERIRLSVCCQPLSVDGQDITLTVSIGVAEYAPGELLQSWLGRADRALYRAKRNGRNRIERADNWRNRLPSLASADESPT
ncbi:GGDEF domain-containing protein [Telmatospirillum siberiense]|uniref:diguanylate cyclase n=1 Tax=Telmatospirillum siberiense TaxID=382514 RepID=A0A2N3PYP5_9PROT|nr:GGDEF domain-containing protein [Telmatospirillum siberiense]PKU25481.1 hypothetical protein CWS72_05280 [Telmatospirillum siberiense]